MNNIEPEDVFWKVTLWRKATSSHVQTIIPDNYLALAECVITSNKSGDYAIELDGIRQLLGFDNNWTVLNLQPLTSIEADNFVDALTIFTRD